MLSIQAMPFRNTPRALLGAFALAAMPARHPAAPTAVPPAAINAKLSEWKVELSERSIPAGTVTFSVANVGSIPHAFEVEGQGIDRQTAIIQPGASATLTLTLKAGTYEIYCPVGEDSHKRLGMETELSVLSGKRSSAPASGVPAYGPAGSAGGGAAPAPVQSIQVASGGPIMSQP